MMVHRIDNRIVQEADNLSKETHIPFRDCLETLIQAYLQTTNNIEPIKEVVCK